jgi:hypothetical protein
MRHRKRRVVETAWANLNSVTNPKTGRKSYEISVNVYRLSKRLAWTGDEINRIRDHFDPAHNRGTRHSTKWKYRDKATAEKLLTLALMKFGE